MLHDNGSESMSERISAALSYLVSGGLVLGDVVNYLDTHAGAFGVILGLLTWFTQAYFGHRRTCAYIASLKDGE